MKKKGWIIALVIGIILVAIIVALAIWIPIVMDNLDEKEDVFVESTLVKAVSISELSTSRFTYNGIAEYFKNDKNEKKGKVDCYIRYDAVVKVGVKMEEITFDIDREAKIIRPTFPKFEITGISLDKSALSFIPDGTDIPLSAAILCCEEDVEKEAKDSEELFDSAEKKMRKTVEALLIPLLDGTEYKIVWE